MKLHNPTAGIFIPDQKPPADALARITHLGIGAHQDDLEFMAVNFLPLVVFSGWFLPN